MFPKTLKKKILKRRYFRRVISNQDIAPMPRKESH